MVSKILSRMNREVRGLHEAAYLLALFTFLSQVLALIRDRAFAHFFGAGPTLDAYFAAFKIPDFVYAFLTLFVSSFALIPLISKRGGSNSKDSGQLIGSVLAVFGVFSIIVSLLLFYFMKDLVPLLFPGFSDSTKATVVTLSHIMLLQPLFLGLSSIVASVVQASRKFILYALAPIFYNLGIIVGAIFFYPTFGVQGLAWGVVLGAVLHLCVQFMPLFLLQGSFSVSFKGDWFADIKEVVLISLPRALALSTNQLLLLFFVSVASLAAAGSVASISFAFNLQSVPLSIIGVSYAVAAFPALASLYAKGERGNFILEVWTAVRHIIFWTAPAIALMVVLRAHVVRVVLGSGQFTWNDTRLTAAVLAAFIISLIAQATLLVFSRAYYASGKSYEPIIFNVLIALSSGLLAYFGLMWFQDATTARFFFEGLFRIGGIPGSETLMIALAYSFSLIVGVFCFGVLFAKQFGFNKNVWQTMFLSFSSSVIGAIFAYGTLQLFGPLLPTDTFIGIFTQGLAAGIVGLIAWASMLYSLNSQELKEVFAILQKLLSQYTHAKKDTDS